MAFVELPDGALTIIEYEAVVGPPWTNTMWWTKDNFNSADLTALASTLRTFVASEMMPVLSNEVTFNKVTAYDMRQSDGQVVVSSDGITTGGDIGPVSVITAALVVTFRTAARGRSARGRNYVTGFTDSKVEERAVVQAAVDDVLAAYVEIQNQLATIGWTHVIASFQQDDVALDPGNARAVTTYDVRSRVVGTQGRRSGRD